MVMCLTSSLIDKKKRRAREGRNNVQPQKKKKIRMSEETTIGLSPIIIEPNPILIEYYQTAKVFEMADMLNSKVGDGEWLYIQSNLSQ